MTLHPYLYETMLRDRERALEHNLRVQEARRRMKTSAAAAEPVVLRLDRVQDDGALARLAQLNGAATPAGRHVLAEVRGTVVAALPLHGGPVLFDPGRRTGHLVPLLELRARQLTGVHVRRRPLLGRRWSRA